MRAGTRRLLASDAPSASRLAANYLENQAKLALGHNPHGGVPALLEDVTAAALDAVVADAGGPAWDGDGFSELRTAVRERAADEIVPILRRVAKILSLSHEVDLALRGLTAPTLASSVADAREQLATLVHDGFVTAVGRDGLGDLERYLRALVHRVQVLPTDPARDRAAVERVQVVNTEVGKTLRLLPAALAAGPDVDKINQMVQELRVSLFAQQIRTAYPISEQRIWRALDRLVDRSA
jgi:ATP-dependent helicase HrpA